MRDLKRYWQEVGAIEERLPRFVWVVNLEGGFPVEVSAAGAAPLLQEKSHRLATEEEVRARQATETALNREAAREDLRRQGIAVVAIRRE
jgi:hypothetical protein